MKKFLAFNIILLHCLVLSTALLAQDNFSGRVLDEEGTAIEDVDLYIPALNLRAKTNGSGEFKLSLSSNEQHKVIIFAYGYQVYESTINGNNEKFREFQLQKLNQNLSEVVILDQKEKVFNLKRLNPVEGTSIYAGKKSEVVLLDKMVGNKASNNARQIFGQVVGLNIYENSDAGLQLNIGGRGLDPNRTSNFNTRQNGYDISADVLGYPESYYTPPAEALEEIQVVRGAASLQYGTQFGGLLNFKMKRPVTDKKIEVVSRQSLGSYNLLSSFNSLSGTVGKFSYYTYFHHKEGDGFRPNAEFNSNNFFINANYDLTDKITLSVDYTYLNYLAQQAGGLTDTQFDTDPLFSNRTRNWFEVDWHLYAAKLEYDITEKTKLSAQFFGLNAERNAVGYRGNPVNLNGNPVSEEDFQDEDINFLFPRDLIKGEFNNYGTEIRLLNRYKFNDRESVFLIGTKFYKSDNSSIQGPNTLSSEADFSLRTDLFPDYANQSDFNFPNLNFALFGENIFNLTEQLSITPGFRIEKIRTESEGSYNQVIYDNAQNPIANNQLTDNRTFDRSFLLLGVGASYYHSENLELYANFSQNYRSITFSDIRVVSPTFIVDPDISDEEGFTADLGIRGKWDETVNFDVGAFALLYNDRIGIILDDRANRVRKNIGKAFIYGLEFFGDFNLLKIMNVKSSQAKFNVFLNAALTQSEYLESEENNVVGKNVEFIPNVNLKTGINFGYKNLLGSVQYSLLGKQFTDVENSSIPEESDNRNGVIGEIPRYDVLDFSLAFSWKFFKIESGINNLLDNKYFTRRATGYPGPGIIPAEPRTFYLTLEAKF